MSTNLTFDPLTHITAVTAVNSPPDLRIGDQIALPLRVIDVIRLPVSADFTIWKVVLSPAGDFHMANRLAVGVECRIISIRPATQQDLEEARR